jgi:tRNA modification GTPase
MSETITAIATHLGEGGIGVIRISGDQSLRIVRQLFHAHGDKFTDSPVPRHVYFGEIRDPDGNCVDQVLLTWFKSPQSYTGEDVVEISGHGGVFVVSKILQLVLSAGARLAEPGEFTRRAFLNRRLDLAQAEAVADLISAESEIALRTAVSHLQGRLSARLNALYDNLLALLAQLEAAMDFPEEGLILQDASKNLQSLRQTKQALDNLIGTYRQGKIYREGARVAMVGKPNVGKSSLLNALLGEDRAIVTPHPGTTRDLLEEKLRIGNIHVNIIDSAGLRHDPEHIEEMGIARTRSALARADLALVIFDNSTPFGADDDLLVREVADKPCLIVINKNDLPAKLEEDKVRARLPGREIIRISAATQAGMEDLLAAIQKFVLQGKRTEESVVITRERQRELLSRASQALEKASASLEQNLPEELIAVDINMALDSLGAVIGKTFEDDLLDHIFSNFCIGK